MVSLENKIICIVGPTASGKSDLAQEIALALNGEIVSADSMQIYREMDIGTGKVIESQQRVKHYGIDLVDPGVPYSAALYQEYARRALEKIDGGGKRALLVGGRVYTYEQHLTITPFLVETMSAIGSRALHRFCRGTWRSGSLGSLHERDPDSAREIHPNNVRRVVRAFELIEEGRATLAKKLACKASRNFIPPFSLE